LLPIGYAGFGVSGLLGMLRQDSSVMAGNVPSPPASDASPFISQWNSGV
jgi:hypothetical protein